MATIIVADGPSARHFIPPADVFVIAINGVIDWIQRADAWFTLDHSQANLQRMRNRRDGVKYYAALPLQAQVSAEIIRYQRIAQRGKEPAEKYSPQWWLWRWSGVPGLNANPNHINTGNSAWGGLQLALKLGAEKCALIGVDGTNDERVSGGKPSSLAHLPLLFDSVADQIQIVNCGHLKTKIPTMTITEALEWLTK